jgi:hypothetical protein
VKKRVGRRKYNKKMSALLDYICRIPVVEVIDGPMAIPVTVSGARLPGPTLRSLTMPTTTAIYNAHSHKINSLLTDIEEQFTLDEHALISITSHFHKLFNIGLGEYGHPMAMMYACARNPVP